MFNPIQFYEAGRVRSGTAFIPNRAGNEMYINISTRAGNGVITYTGVSSNIPITPDKYKDFTTDRVGASTVAVSNTVGVFGNLLIKYLEGLGDVYSIWIGFLDKSLSGNNQKDQLAFLPIQNFLAQFPNLYSLYINERAGGNDGIQTGMIGDFALIQNSLERVLIDSLDVKHNFQSDGVYINFSNFSNQSKLKFFRNNYNNPNLKLLGDVSKLPPLCNHFYLKKVSSSSAITYTAGRIWTSIFDTFSIPFAFTPTENDNIFIDADNSIISGTGAKMFDMFGARSPLSDVPVASLISKGFTINCKRATKRIRYLRDTLDGSTANTVSHWIEIEIYQGLKNIAFGKNVKAYTGAGVFITDTNMVTDGVVSNSPQFAYGGKNYVVLDLGTNEFITSINIRHYFPGRAYKTKLEVSEDGITWELLFNSLVSGGYMEVAEGKTYNF